jgi:hypothetical protein
VGEPQLLVLTSKTKVVQWDLSQSLLMMIASVFGIFGGYSAKPIHSERKRNFILFGFAIAMGCAFCFQCVELSFGLQYSQCLSTSDPTL